MLLGVVFRIYLLSLFCLMCCLIFLFYIFFLLISCQNGLCLDENKALRHMLLV